MSILVPFSPIAWFPHFATYKRPTFPPPSHFYFGSTPIVVVLNAGASAFVTCGGRASEGNPPTQTNAPTRIHPHQHRPTGWKAGPHPPSPPPRSDRPMAMAVVACGTTDAARGTLPLEPLAFPWPPSPSPPVPEGASLPSPPLGTGDSIGEGAGIVRPRATQHHSLVPDSTPPPPRKKARPVVRCPIDPAASRSPPPLPLSLPLPTPWNPAQGEIEGGGGGFCIVLYGNGNQGTGPPRALTFSPKKSQEEEGCMGA